MFSAFFQLASLGDINALSKKLATLNLLGVQIMSEIAQFAALQAEHNTKIESAIAGLTADITSLTGQIEALKASQSAAQTLSPEDKAILDALVAKSGAIADSLTALDALTPPDVPVPPAP